MNFRPVIFLGAVLAALGVANGAVGAHLLEKRVQEGTIAQKQLDQFETAVRYQIYHALGLLVIGALAQARPSRWLSAAAITMTLGCLLFCGGLYAYIAVVAQQLPYTGVVHIVPFGGGLFIVSWVLVALGAWKK